MGNQCRTVSKEQLKELLIYAPDTGIFTWKVSRGTAREGNIAGYKTNNGYIAIKISGIFYKAHRLAWLYIHGKFPDYEVDHLDGVKDNNRILNLRSVTHSVNGKNQRKPVNNTSGIIGVVWYKTSNKWRAQIKVEGKQIHIGYFSDIADAAKARKKTEEKYFFHENHGS